MPDPISAIIGTVGGALIGGISSNNAAEAQVNAAKDSADAQLKANEQNIAFQKWLYGEQTAQNKPWYDSGISALSKLNAGLENGAFDPGKLDTSSIATPGSFTGALKQATDPGSFTGALKQATDPGKLDLSGIKDPGAFDPNSVDLLSDPGYQFRMTEGQKALDRSAATRGLTQSGAQQRATLNYAQGVGSQEYGDAYNRAMQQYGTQVDQYGRAVNNAKSVYGSSVDQYGREQAANQGQYNNLLTQYGTSVDEYGRLVNSKTADYNSNANRLQNQFGNLLSLSNAGQSAAYNNNAAATASGSQISNSLINNGNAMANMYTAQGNAKANGTAGIATSANQGIQNYLSYNAMRNNPYSLKSNINNSFAKGFGTIY